MIRNTLQTSLTLICLVSVQLLSAQTDSLPPAPARHHMDQPSWTHDASVLQRTASIKNLMETNMNKYGKILPEAAHVEDSLEQLRVILDIQEYIKLIGSWERATQNPYLGRYIPEAPDMSMVVFEKPDANDKEGNAPGWSPPGARVNSATNFADGLAKFLVNRTKTELNAAFLESLSEQCKKNIYLQRLFPRTGHLLGLMQERVYNFNPFLVEIRDASAADLNLLPENLASLLDSDADLHIPKTERIWLADALFVRKMLLDPKFKGKMFFDRLSKRVHLEKATPIQKSIAGGLGMLVIGADCFEDYKEYEWPENRDTLYRDIFLGVMYEDYKNVEIGNQTLGQIMPTIPDDSLFQLFSRYRDVFIDIEAVFDRNKGNGFRVIEPMPYRDGTFAPEPHPDFLQVVEVVNRTMQFAETFTRVLTPTDTETHKKLQESAQACDFFTRLTWKTYEKKWGEVLLYTGSLVALMAGDNEVTCKFMRYGSFLSSLPACTTSDEVAALIETFTLPPGSSRTKKQSPFTVGIGSYVGGFGGWEFLKNVNTQDRVATTLSLSAPVGLALSKGYHGWSFTGFATLIDVGAFTAFRFDDANYTAELPAMTLANIFSPGAALVVGVPRYPFAFGLNAQVGPNIRGITDDAVYQFNETGAWRFGATVTVDIPLLNFYSAGGGDRCF